MKIGVVSDTHSRDLPPQMMKDLEGVDLIVHTGDFCSVQDVQRFRKINKLEAVYGNMDEPEVRKLFPRRKIIEVGPIKIGLFHGEGPRPGVLETVKREFQKDRIDVAIFGHSHQPLNEVKDGVLFFNPGSPNDTVGAPYCSYGIIEIIDGQPVGKVIKVK